MDLIARYPAIALITVIVFQSATAQDWGERATWPGTTNTYAVYCKNFQYHETPFRITDMRNGDPTTLYSDKSYYEIRSLDVYRAWDGTQYFDNQPVIFFIHGGGWIDGYRDWYGFVPMSFTAEKGWVTVVIDYRLTSTNVFIADPYCTDRDHCPVSTDRTKAAWYPDNIEDVASAFRWTASCIATNGGNTNQMVVFGQSAGAHLASLFAVHTNYADTLRPSIRGVVTMSGAYTVTNLTSSLYLPLYSGIISETFAGGVTNKLLLDNASPMKYLQSGLSLPPFYVLYSPLTGDLPGFYEESVEFHNRLETLGYTVSHDLLAGYDHVSEMSAIAYTNLMPTRLIISYVESLLGLSNAPPDSADVFRLYCNGQSATYEHLFTMNATEKDVLASGSSWTYEGIAWYAMTNRVAGSTPLYRLYCPSARQHHYTVDATEYAVLTLPDSGWNGEDIQYYVFPSQLSGRIPVYRFYNAAYVLHHFTTSSDELTSINDHPEWGYTYEGIAFYVYANR